VVKALSVIDDIKLIHLPRLDDFAKWGEAVARILGYKERQFLEAYYDNIGKQNAEAVENELPQNTNPTFKKNQ
jgi:hypothetical protein